METPLQKLFYSFHHPRDGTQEKDADRAVHVVYYDFLPQQGSRPQRGFQGFPRNRPQMFSSYVQCFLSMAGDRGSRREGEVNPGILSGQELDRGGRRHVSVEEYFKQIAVLTSNKRRSACGVQKHHPGGLLSETHFRESSVKRKCLLVNSLLT